MQSSVKINQISLDESGEHIGVCSEDGKVRQSSNPGSQMTLNSVQLYNNGHYGVINQCLS